MGSIRGKTHNLPDTAHSTGQHFNGAMERYMRGFDSAQNSPSPATAQHQHSEDTSGAMDDSSGKGSKVQAHNISGVVMDITAFKVSHSVDIDATALQAKKWSA